VPVLLTGGCIKRGGAGPGREPVAVGEPSNVPDVGQDARGHDRADAVNVHQVGATFEDERLELGGGLLHLCLDRDQFGELLGGDPSSCLPGDVARAHRSEHSLGLTGGDVLLRLSRKQFRE